MSSRFEDTPAAARVRRSRAAVRQLRDLLRVEILHHTGADHLPGETELMIAYQASRSTVRGALSLLRDEGMIDRLQGVGTVVASNPLFVSIGHIEPQLPRDLQPHRPSDTRFVPRILEKAVVATPPVVRSRLQTHDSECLRIEYAIPVENRPAGLATNYVLFPEAQGLLDTPFFGNWYDYLDSAGIAAGDSAMAYSCVSADEMVAEYLGTSAGHPTLFVDQVIRNAELRPFNFAVLYIRTDRIVFHSQTPLGAPGGTQ